MTRRHALALPAMLVVLAAGCSADGAPATTTSGAQPTVPVTTTAPPAPTTTSAASRPTTTVPEPFDPIEATIPEMQAAMDEGRLTAVDLVDAYLGRIAAYDTAGPGLNAMIAINPQARAEASALDAERAESGRRGLLHGIPIVVKDNINTADMATTGGSLALEGFLTGDDAFQVALLRAAGAVIIGKANLHELARDITTVSSLGGQTLNPYDPTRNPGGSSGGTAVAVSANFAAVGLGTDTCGSIRIPAAHNNLYGLRPTPGLSSLAGVMPLTWSSDTVGPITRSVVDLALVLEATVGPYPGDRGSGAPPSFVQAVDPNGLSGKRIGVLEALFDGSHPGVASVTRASLDAMASNGAHVEPVVLAGLDTLRGSAASVLLSEFRFAFDEYLAAYPHAPVGSLAALVERGLHHPAVDAQLRRAVAVTGLDSDEYRDALSRRDLVRDAVAAFMDEHDLDALAYPTIRQPAAPIGAPQSGSNCGTAAVGGLPAIVVPAGFTEEGLPVGLELLGRPFGEATLIAIAAGYEAHSDVRRLPPTTPRLP
jgi:amidase